ncbi:FMN reductase [Paenibacillus sp. J31TS4]|uniref:NADPH-dependent FMN reductase n=1 Tax=Paenibacillus sp. J31TS4 TaxID=2807195 RepID=UPI001B0192EB|nr:NADPH-dependent FMN reductase [Paenibacillus sp. J31TS4]GIP37145.1 FMN reductase [Paenibacillus sp. J31TS4]
MRVAAIIGSNREHSFNRMLVDYIAKTYREQLDVEIADIRELPFYNQDHEASPPASVLQFREQIAEADAVLWATPEYNYSIPGVLKNAIDWLSRGDKVLVGKPSWIVGASMGTLGSVRAQGHLRDILFSPGVSSPLLPGNEVYVGQVHEKFDAEGRLLHEPTAAFLDIVVSNFLTWHAKQTGRA